MTAGVTIACAVVVLALPSAVLAFGTKFEVEKSPVSADSRAIDTVRSDSGTRLARGLSLQWLGRGPEYLFTPAKNPNRPDRSVTVAVRLDSRALKTITVFGKADPGSADANLRLAQSPFNLGLARGYRNFAQDLVPSTLARRTDPPDLSRYTLVPSSKAREEPRFAPRVVFDEKTTTGRAPRTFAGDKEDQVDLGGSYRVSRNLDVTAGVRYSSQDRERLLPLTDGNKDNQAVYVGTQFHF